MNPLKIIHVILLVAIVILLSNCNTKTQNNSKNIPEVKIIEVANNLKIPWTIDFTDDGRLFFTQKEGEIMVMNKEQSKTDIWAKLAVAKTGTAGLTGMAIHPQFIDNKFIFVYAVFPYTDREDTFFSRVIRFKDSSNIGVDKTIILDSLPVYDTHSGGGLSFGPDGKLYVSLGDAEKLDSVQSMSSLIGKILRVNSDGTIPHNNPFKDSPIFSIGHRNPQGFAWHPEKSILFATEHGPSDFPGEGGRRDQDELNVIVAKGNYGWPQYSGIHNLEGYYDPLVDWTPGIAPNGIDFYINEKSKWHHHLFVGGMKGQQLRRVKLKENTTTFGWEIVEEESLFLEKYGRIRAVKMGPDGYLYFSTTNRDGFGRRRNLIKENDDKIFKVKFY
ncbi:MAG: PQQ-dependent sugar dehydrogenase [Flavobacteriaceae bacterium]|nr:PQQ-dependent sugar dehydrogenase [Flavobacteriaceae bacterium]